MTASTPSGTVTFLFHQTLRATAAAPILLARPAPTVAATIHGHLEGSEPPWGQVGLDLRSKANELVASIPDNETHHARGAAMDRHEIVALTLAALDANGCDRHP